MTQPAPSVFALALAAGLAASPLAAAGPAADPGQTMIVLDASGSMWGQIEGKPKLEIARETLATVLREAPAGASLGLIAYGHRSKGDCSDIEVLVPAGPGTADAIAAAAARLKFLGMTPLSDAVTRAARELRHTERRATVILVTDGLETCKADPCALGKALEESGVDFTTHVVGFGLSAEEGKQVACLAENTGGRYFAANDAAGLAGALSAAVVEAPAPEPPPPASLEAPVQVPIASRVQITWDGPGTRFDEVQIFDPSGRGGLGVVVDTRRVSVDPGFAQKRVELIAPGVPGPYQLRYYHSEQRRVIATRDIEAVPATVALDAPEEIGIGADIVVGWTGPGEQFDEVQVFDPAGDGGRGRVVDGRRVRTDKEFAQRRATVVAPATPGDYVLRYWNGHNREVLAERPLRVVEVAVTLEAPASVPMGSTVVIAWTGPGAQFDEVQILDPDAPSATLRDGRRVRTDKEFAQRRVSLVAPAVPGRYQIRYWNGHNRQVLATRALEVTPVEVTLAAPAKAAAGANLPVQWTGPGGRFDEVQVVDPAANGGRGKTLAGRRVATDAGFAQRTVTLRLPDAPGTYELRYWSGDSRIVLATRALTVE